MKNIVFKNHIINIVVGVILIAFTVTAYFMEWYKDFLAIIVGVILLGLSIKRFIYSFKKIVSKYATLALIIELLLDILFCGLLFYYQQHIQLYAGLILYIRGVTYLIINYMTTRKVFFVQYMMNIVYITLGAFLMFTSMDFVQYLEIGVALFVLVLGAIYLYDGIISALKIKKKKKIFFSKIDEKRTPMIPDPVIEPKVVEEEVVAPQEEKPVEIKPVVSKQETVKPEATKPKINKPQIDYTKLTVTELKIVAKEKGVTGYSTLSKAELIQRINQKKTV